MKKSNSTKKSNPQKKTQTASIAHRTQKPHSKSKQLPEVNLKDFKVNTSTTQLEIDHEIAKCLDTLDRQGLKFLRETIKSSNLFNTQEIKEQIQRSPQNLKQKKSSKKKQQTIFQEIEDQPDQQTDLHHNQSQKNGNSIKLKNYQSHKSQKKTFQMKLLGKKSVLEKQERDAIFYFQSEQKPIQSQHKIIQLNQKQKKQQALNLDQGQKQIPSQQQSQCFSKDENNNDIRGLFNRISNLSPSKIQKIQQMLGILENNRSQQKQPYFFSRNQYIETVKQRPTSKSKKSQKASCLYDNFKKQKSYKSISKSKLQYENIDDEKEQIQQEIMKHEENQIQKQPLNKSSFISSQVKTLNNFESLPMNEPIFTNIGSDSKNKIKLKFLTKNQIRTEISKKQQQSVDNQINNKEVSELQQSQLKSMSNTQGKMMRIKKKNTQYNSPKVILRIIGNRGHPSMAGLTSVQLFNWNGQKIQIKRQKIIQPNHPKIMNIFNAKNHTIDQINMWCSVLNDNKIDIQIDLAQKIGAVRVWNYNKSQLQSTKESDYIQLWLNGDKEWEGKLKNGSYNEYEDYYTQILINQNIIIQASKDQQINSITQNRQWLQKQQKYQIDQKIKFLQTEQQQSPTKKNTKIQRTTNVEINFDYQSLITKKTPQKCQITMQPQFISQPSPIILKKPEFINEHIDILAHFNKSISKQNLQKQKQKEQSYFDNNQIYQNSPMKKQKLIQQKKELYRKKQANFDWGEDLMSNSIFKDIKEGQKKFKKQSNKVIEKQTKLQSIAQKKLQQPTKKVDLDNLIDQLNDMMGGKIQSEQFIIPQIPKGKTFEVIIYSNWGDYNYTGINGIQLFNSDGNIETPEKVCVDGTELAQQTRMRIFSGNYLTTDEKNQWKLKKVGKVVLTFEMKHSIKLSLIRLWNFNGHRVHSTIGIKLCIIKLDSKPIFQGQIRKSSGGAEDAHKYCQYILFTSDQTIIKKIKQNDWLSSIKKKEKQETILFKSSITDFQRPQTKNLKAQKIEELIIKKQNKGGIKLPKRNCNQYEPPILPQGYVVRLFLHSTWGDRYFIGLNGIQLFDENGQNILKDKSIVMSAYPSSVSVLPGYQNDQRQVNNLINDLNHSKLNKNIWLTPFQSDLQKLQKQKVNYISIQLPKAKKISGINIYNYAKTPQRGAHEISIYIDQYLLYKGYLRKYDSDCLQQHTSFVFTKDPNLLQKINYSGYNEDAIRPQVGLVNQGKILKKGNTYADKKNVQEERPLSSYAIK